MTEGIEMVINEIKLTKQELKSIIEAVEVRITLKIEDINRRLSKVEKQNQLFEEKIEQLERKSKENNIIIFGLKHPAQNISVDFITSEFRRLIEVDIQELDIKNFYALGKTETAPIKVEFVSILKKNSILTNSKKLKGTNITISNDLTIKQREENKTLRKHLNLARQDENTNCFIKRNKLYVNNKIYSVKDLEQSEERVETAEKSKINSAPGTPTPTLRSNNPQEIELTKRELLTQSNNTNNTSVFSPINTFSENTKKYTKEAFPQKQKRDNEEKSKVETRSIKSRNDSKSSLNKNKI